MMVSVVAQRTIAVASLRLHAVRHRRGSFISVTSAAAADGWRHHLERTCRRIRLMLCCKTRRWWWRECTEVVVHRVLRSSTTGIHQTATTTTTAARVDIVCILRATTTASTAHP